MTIEDKLLALYGYFNKEGKEAEDLKQQRDYASQNPEIKSFDGVIYCATPYIVDFVKGGFAKISNTYGSKKVSVDVLEKVFDAKELEHLFKDRYQEE